MSPRDEPRTPSVLVHHGLRQGGRTFLPPPPLMAYRCVHAESRGPSVQHASLRRHESSPPRAGRPLSGHGRARRLGCDDKSNGNGVAHPKSQFVAVACVPGFTLAWVVMRCTRAPVRSGGSPSTSDVHAVDKERRKSITTRATPRAGSHAGTLKVGR